jgi:hypothetical protein
MCLDIRKLKPGDLTFDKVSKAACMIMATEHKDNNVIVITWMRLWGFGDRADPIFQTIYDKRSGYILEYEDRIGFTNER